jgi:NADPH:quinone reductase-like Zn-dependent oxidoreductase
MINMGILVESWPFVPGCDAAGIVVKVGEQAASIFNVGDEVCGCTRLGTKGYSTCQEFVNSSSHSRCASKPTYLLRSS